MMPSLPEAVTHSQYEEGRDCGLLPASIQPKKPHTVRFREVKAPTLDVYAYDHLAIVLKVQHLGSYSLVGAQVRGFKGFTKMTFGVNSSGIAFRHEPMPTDLEEIPYAAEYGYFVGETDTAHGSELVTSESENIQSAEELLGRLTLAR